jgi:hypothetical protein
MFNEATIQASCALKLPEALQLSEINQPALGYVFNLNSSLNGCRYRIETAKLQDANPIQSYWYLTDRFAGGGP